MPLRRKKTNIADKEQTDALQASAYQSVKEQPAELAPEADVAAAQSSVKTSRVDSNRLELLITIVDRQKAEFYADVIQSFEVNMQLLARAQGTASVQTLEMLGLQNNQKAVIFSVIREERVQDVLAALKDRFDRIRNGKGIAYTVPLTSVIGASLYAFLSNNKDMAAKE